MLLVFRTIITCTMVKFPHGMFLFGWLTLISFENTTLFGGQHFFFKLTMYFTFALIVSAKKNKV
jgi:hypothetical protein